MRIFLSYSSADRDLANRIHLSLIAQHHDVFFDREDLAPGLEYDSRIAEEVTRTDLFLFLISPDSVSPGRYTLNELGMVQRRWNHPAKRVLPVMVRPTPMDQIPPYLKAVTIMQPAGDIPAEVSDYVRRIRPPWPKWLGWTISGSAAGIVAVALWSFSGMSTPVRQATDLLQAARSLHAAGEYREAFDKSLEANTQLMEAPLSPLFQHHLAEDIHIQRIESVLAWLENMRISEGERFSDVVNKTLPTLDEAIATSTGEGKANLLSYRGWADFLRSRDSGLKTSPEPYYREAVAIDPANVSAHTKWAHWIIWTHGKLDEAQAHFDAALASGYKRPYIREQQFLVMKNLGGDRGDWEVLRIAHDMWIEQEPIPALGLQQVRRIYERACGSAYSTGKLDEIANVLPEQEHITLIRSLFPLRDSSPDPTYWVQPCLARLQEHAGLKSEAVETYRSIRTSYPTTHQYWTMANEAIKRLSRVTQKLN